VLWLLIIEVADTSLERDRAKAAIYHSAGVQEDWIVNIESQRIERFPFFGTSELQPPSLITCGNAGLDSRWTNRFSY
jgi:hypothetical protein